MSTDIEDFQLIEAEQPKPLPTHTHPDMLQLQEEPSESLEKYVQADRAKMTYENRLNFYECPYDEGSPESKIHYFFQRDGSLKQWNKLVKKTHAALRAKGVWPPPEVEYVDSPAKFHYRIKYEGINKVFE